MAGSRSTYAHTKAWRSRPGNMEKAREASRRSMAKRRKDCAPAFWHKELQRRAAKQSREFDLTEEFLTTLFTQTHCAQTGIAFRHDWDGGARQNPFAPSVDRVDSTKGYTRDNVQLVCWAYNVAKSVWPDEVVLEMARALVSKHG